MKKIIIGIIAILFLSGVILNNIGSGKVYIRKLDEGYQLIVNKKPYIIKGVVYSPVPIGKNYTYDFWSDPKKLYLYDAKLMRAMGVNSIRVYQPGIDPKKTKKAIRELYKKFRIRVAMGHWLGFWDNANYADNNFRERVKKDVMDMVRAYKNEKGILLWILGNENNVSFSYGPQTLNLWTTDEIEALGDPYLKRQARAKFYYSFVNDIAKEIHKIDPNHPVVLANAELTDIDVAGPVSHDVDMLGCSVYRGKVFSNFFREVDKKFKKPVIVTEFGCDRYDAFLNKEDQNAQAEFITAQWKDIEKNTFKSNGVGNALGGFIFEWTDEWWKFNESDPTRWYMHDTAASWSNGAYYFDIKAPQNLNVNEEWWGICAVKKKGDGPDEREPTKAYFALKELWRR